MRSGVKHRFKFVLFVISLVILYIALLCFFSAIWYVNTYGRIGFDSILFTLTGGLNGVQAGLVQAYLLNGMLPATLCWLGLGAVVCTPWTRLFPGKLVWFTHGVRSGVCLVLSLLFLGHAAWNSQLLEYVSANNRETSLYEEYYKDPNAVSITFPETKRNLIYIFLESMETSYLSEDLGGGTERNLIPELYTLANDNVNFSHNETVGGFLQVPGATWTVGAMVAQTGGVPLKVPDNVADVNSYGQNGTFLPGLTTLMDILHDNGYYQALMVGSDSDFGGRKTFFSTHGVDRIYDIYTARADGIVPQDYFVWWGMEDLHLFEYAKQELTKIAAGDQPFAFTMLTVDTHHIGGYTCSLCESEYEESYENAIACSSRQVYAFVQWLQQQDFYENTTVVITGDHNSMDAGYFSRNYDELYTRHVYNCFLNAPISPVHSKDRVFCTPDMFPTTLASLGCTIEGDRLGLGTNLFSEVPTLAEELGYQSFGDDLLSNPEFYATHFFAPEDQ